MAGNVIATTWVEVIPEMQGSRTALAKDIGAELDPAAETAGESAGEKASESFASKLKKGLAAATIIGTGMFAAMSQLSETAIETTSNMGKLDTAFETSGHTAETARSVYDGFVGILGETDTAVEASNHLAKLTDSTEELGQWTDIAAGIYATFGDSLPLEGLTEAANETANTGVVTGSFADALNWASASIEQWSAALANHPAAQAAFNAAVEGGASAEDAFNSALATCSDEAERATLITDTMTGIYSEVGQTYQETNADVIAANKAQSDFNLALSELGRTVMPVVTGVTQLGTALISGGLDLLEPIASNFQTIVDVASPFAVGIGVAAAALGLLWAAASGQSILGLVTGLMSGTSVMGLFTTATNLAKAAWAALQLLWAANPIGVVIALVAALVAALVWFFTQTELGQQLWSQFMTWLQEAWTNVSAFFASLWEGIVSFFTNAGTNAQNTWSAVTSFFGSIPGAIMGFFGSIGSWLGSLFQGAADTVNSAWSGVLNFFGSIPNSIMSIFSNAGSWLIEAGKAIIDGLWNGLKSRWDSVTGWFSGLGEQIISLKGPPAYDKVMLEENGELTMYGYGQGLLSGWDDVQKKIEGINAGVQAQVTSTVSASSSNASSVATAANGGGGISVSVNDVTYNDYPGIIKATSDYIAALRDEAAI